MTHSARPVDPGHRVLLDSLQAAAGHAVIVPPHADPGRSHATSGRPYFGLSVPRQRQTVKAWLADQRTSSPERIFATVQSLLRGVSYEEKTSGCMILKERREVRRLATPGDVDGWLGDLRGWAEVDSLCQSVFGADELLGAWEAWRGAIVRLCKSENHNKRRAALVLLTGPVRHSTDERLAHLAFALVDRQREDRDPLITKAVSWLLRALSHSNAAAVADYLDRSESQLPPIAVRETRTLLRTGTKSGKVAASRRSGT